jgi:amino acid permease
MGSEQQYVAVSSPTARSANYRQTMEVDDRGNKNGVALQPQQQQPPHTTTTGLCGTSANLVNTIVGAGIVGIPFAIEQSGLIVGVLLLLLVSWMTAQSLRLLVELAGHHPVLAGKNITTFETLMQVPFGNAGRNFMLVSMFVFAYGAMVAYLIVIKDTVPTIISFGDTDWQRNLVMLVTSLVLMVRNERHTIVAGSFCGSC